MAKNTTLISTASTARWWLKWRCTEQALDDKGEHPSIKAAIEVVEQRIAMLARFEGTYFETSITRHREALEVLGSALEAPEAPETDISTPDPTPQKPRQLVLNLFDFSL